MQRETHTTVLLHEAIDALQIKPDATIVDATLGAGGHSAEIVKKLDPRGRLLAFDVDQSAIDEAELLTISDSEVVLITENFRHIDAVLRQQNIDEVDGILADLGWRSEQFAGSGRGFSFLVDEPLEMTFGNPEDYVCTAHDLVNEWEETSIADVIYGYGEERFSRRIAKAIVTARAAAPIESSLQLAEIVESAIPRIARSRKIHPATKTFQAIRIAVNDELGALKEFIADGFSNLARDGNMAIISFHSLEDRIVKQFFRELAHAEKGTVVTKKPITATDEEIKANPRSRSAKMRVITKN